MNEILQAITTVGFPIVMCGAMAYYVKYMTDKHREDGLKQDELNRAEREKVAEQHQKEMSEVTTALNNNTLALNRLCEKLDK